MKCTLEFRDQGIHENIIQISQRSDSQVNNRCSPPAEGNVWSGRLRLQKVGFVTPRKIF